MRNVVWKSNVEIGLTLGGEGLGQGDGLMESGTKRTNDKRKCVHKFYEIN